MTNAVSPVGHKEKRFLDALEALFTGGEVDGDSGFVNLMRMKRGYFCSTRPKLMAAIESRIHPEDYPFREEMFDKLYTFFQRYFCESGSIYFRHLPAFSKVYERVYADGQDIALAWKTQMLYYVKSDILVRSMPVTLTTKSPWFKQSHFYFDASEMEHKQNNEKRDFVFTFASVEGKGRQAVVHLKVSYSQQGNGTKHDDIIKAARKNEVELTDEELQKALNIFRRQTEADFFIHKDAGGFLREQFDLWVYQYLFKEETVFSEKRIRQIQAIRDTAYDIINLIAQFEDELRRVWEKPKFVRNVNYVVTLDKLTDAVLKKLAKHKGANAQVKEWRELGMVDDKFSLAKIFNGQGNLRGKNGVSGDYKFLPLDTRHFKNLELEILDGLGNLDEALDGELVHSENWQALNTLQPRYQGKVKCVYIDPPYNTGNNDFNYRDSYQHSSWMSMAENRLTASLSLLSSGGVTFSFIDDNEQHHLRVLMDKVFSEKNFITNYIWKSRSGKEHTAKHVSSNHENILCYAANIGELDFVKETRISEGGRFSDDKGAYSREQLRQWGTNDRRIDRPTMYYPVTAPDGTEIYPIKENGKEGCWRVEQKRMEKLIAAGEADFVNDGGKWSIYAKKYAGKETSTAYNSILDSYGTSATGTLELKKFFVDKVFDTTKPVSLAKHLIHISNSKTTAAIILDYFAGSGTTAHAVIDLNREDGGNRKYLLIEMGEYFHTVLLPRIKKVVYAKDWKDGKPVSHDGSSHLFKYYTIEQYEESLNKSRCHYKDREQLELNVDKSPFEQYVFFADDKFAHVVKAQKNGKLKINLGDLYPDIDIAESLSNILGKPIRKRAADSVTFADGSVEKINPEKMTEEEKIRFISLIKPYLWWGE